jgi:pimeloyl-ACP methyl ester carboxylesterase
MGTYSLTPSRGYYTFAPPSRAISVTADSTGQDFDAARKPLVFVPGIMGSYIYDTNNNNKELWPSICDSGRSGKLRDLTRDKILVADIIRTYTGNKDLQYVPECTGRDDIIYSNLVDRLVTGEGYVEYPPIDDRQRVFTTPLIRCQQARNAMQRGNIYDPPTLFVFAYDWRQSNASSAHELKQYIDCIHEIYSDRPIDILTHSMGGLVARRYLLDNPHNHHVARLITVAAPFLGAPRAITAITSGDYPGVAGFGSQLLPDELTDIASTAVGAHELLPSPAYFTLAGETQDCPFTQVVVSHGEAEGGCSSFNVFSSWIDRHIIGSNPGSSTLNFHTYLNNAQDDWRQDASVLTPVPEYYHLYGVGAFANTLQSVEERQTCYVLIGLPFPCITSIQSTESMAEGDKTVTKLSARRIWNGVSYNALNMPAPIEIKGGADETDHTGLVRSTLGVNNIISVLRSGRTMSASSQKTATEMDGNYIRATNVHSLTVLDNQGRTNPPQISFYRLSEGSYLVALPSDQVFTATIELKALEPAFLDLRTGTGEVTRRTIRYQDLVFGGNRLAAVVIQPEGFGPLLRDANNDSVFETAVNPTINIAGTAANDNTPPVLAISGVADGDRLRLSVTASDSAGVKAIWYSLDGTTFASYTMPLDLDPLTTSSIYVFADDQLANRSDLVTYNLGITQVYIPTVHR